jgi:hypothetical protein
VQTELLVKYPHADVRVYAIWFDMVDEDSRSRWRPDLLTDARVIHRWDEQKSVGTWYNQHAAAMRARLTAESKWTGETLWDSYLLYDADARWDDQPAGLIHWGRTIMASRATLHDDFERLFGQQP